MNAVPGNSEILNAKANINTEIILKNDKIEIKFFTLVLFTSFSSY